MPTKKPTNTWGKQNGAPLKFNPKPYEAALLGVFLNFEKYRPEVADDATSSLAADQVGMDACVKFGDFMSNTGRIIRLLAGCTHFTHF